MNIEDYPLISTTTFRVIGGDNSSVSIIKDELKFLSNTFDVPYNQVIDEFNEYNMYVWSIPYEED